MLTRLEAIDRATRIWGKNDVYNIEPSGTPGCWIVDIRSDARVHMLDGNGHTVCHQTCAIKEDRLPW